LAAEPDAYPTASRTLSVVENYFESHEYPGIFQILAGNEQQGGPRKAELTTPNSQTKPEQGHI
jgi:hypothetical protein